MCTQTAAAPRVRSSPSRLAVRAGARQLGARRGTGVSRRARRGAPVRSRRKNCNPPSQPTAVWARCGDRIRCWETVRVRSTWRSPDSRGQTGAEPADGIWRSWGMVRSNLFDTIFENRTSSHSTQGGWGAPRGQDQVLGTNGKRSGSGPPGGAQIHEDRRKQILSGVGGGW